MSALELCVCRRVCSDPYVFSPIPGAFVARCATCQASTSNYPTESAAITAWNMMWLGRELVEAGRRLRDILEYSANQDGGDYDPETAKAVATFDALLARAQPERGSAA